MELKGDSTSAFSFCFTLLNIKGLSSLFKKCCWAQYLFQPYSSTALHVNSLRGLSPLCWMTFSIIQFVLVSPGCKWHPLGLSVITLLGFTLFCYWVQGSRVKFFSMWASYTTAWAPIKLPIWLKCVNSTSSWADTKVSLEKRSSHVWSGVIRFFHVHAFVFTLGSTWQY